MAHRPPADRPPAPPLHTWLAAQSRRRRAVAALVIVTAVGAAALAVRNAQQTPPGPLDRTRAQLVSMADLPALDVRVDGTTQRVRLIGVGATDQRVVAGLPVSEGALLDLTQPPGEAGVYAYSTDGVMINERLIAVGAARADRTADHPLGQWFARVEGFARRGGAGVWALTVDLTD